MIAPDEANAGSASGPGALPAALHWTLVPAATLAGWLTAWVMVLLVGGALHAALSETTLERLLPVDYRMAGQGAAMAMGWVAGATVAPPRRRWMAAVVLFALGARLAWALLRWWYFPESHPRAYQGSLVPLIGTLLGGLVAVTAVTAWDFASRRRGAAREAPA